MKIAIAQLNPTIGDIKNNLKQIKETVNIAEKKGAKLILTPELSLCGYPPKDLLLNKNFLGQMKKELEQFAQEINPQISVLIGIAVINDNAEKEGKKTLYNSSALIRNGKIETFFHKRLLPTYDVFEEDRYFSAGNEANYFYLDDVKIGVTICEDLWNQEDFWGKKNYTTNPVKDLVNLDVDLIVNLSASPYVVQKQQVREKMLIYLSKQYKKSLIYVNQVGGNDDLIFDGNSFVVDKKGNIINKAKNFQQDLIYVDYCKKNQDLISENKINLVNITKEEEIYQALVLGVKDYAKKCGFKQAIIGLSGGIDSALVATIAVSALGKDNVLGVLMPSPYSSAHSITDAEQLVNNLGIKSEKLPIQEVMKSYDSTLHPLFKNTEFGIAEENLQSRIRGTLLMAIANKFGYLLLSTGNKSEMAVGYCTLYGDMNGGLAVIADLPKTQVFSLCHWLNQEKEIIPHNILTKPPSAELKPDQKDQDSLPPYEILDDILERYINHHQSVTEIENSGHDLDTINKVIKLVVRAEFKRKQAPPGLKITDRAFGTGWKMPIASRWI
ncbi:NAD+ synthase [Cyanobacterium aponinum UTEX 3222]|uniref:Glutamine-dependent NAD(+) synthetase n=1 Tax=Cyanobacterium aponinum AL20115 TaxID=3090662 RepID=A0AAF0ZBC1_9CHRO|nr:NAD+ synthase [Cyanobacterium aponinum]PHV63081.1 NAD+ synthase [Cyanobacterium aponinum IPPAS B-1201]WPF88818.1 NAD+ synthase [Cyanobacterium aponinum AL20115]WRL42277.1 NAD+ synthase [Cyanobacterium aponinum UTEX 3222]